MKQPHAIIENEAQAVQLAELLNGDERTRPVVVVSTPSGRRDPWIDVDDVRDALVDLAEVVLIRTGPHSWAFSEKMPAGTQVYGGAGRAYPLGHDWVSDLARSPLRFAYDADEGQRATQLLIDDALDMAAAAGLLEAQERVTRSVRRGVVKGVVADRALVDLDGATANVAPPLAFAGVDIERVLAKGMAVEGWFDPGARWLDVRGSRRDPAEALAEYAVGDVVLAQVHEVERDRASVFLHPLVEVPVERESVTSNPLDDLRDLLSPGEVLPVRVADVGPAWRLLLDVDDDEVPRPAVSLLPGGPPWLVVPADEEDALAASVPAQPAAMPEVSLDADAEQLALEASLAALEKSLDAATPAVQGAEPPHNRVPSPLQLDPSRRSHTAPRPAARRAVPEPSAAVRTMSLTIADLKAQLAQLRQELEPLQARLRGLEQENAGLAAETVRQRREIEHQERLLQQARSRLRKAGQGKHLPADAPTFADAEAGFRHAVVTAWARRTPVAEQPEVPLPDYTLGPRFLASVRALEGVTEEKIADVAFEILTDRAKGLPGRELHALRSGQAGGSPQRVRDRDGATAWRAALQRNTPSARRIHFWRLPDGSIELSRVVLHDDMEP